MDFSQILTNLMEIRNISAYRMHKDTKIPEATIGRWKNGVVSPTQENLIQIAKYFNVSVDYLLGNEQKEKPTIVIDDERIAEAAELMSRLPRDQFDQIMKILHTFEDK